jgi:tripartite-type tricarboxylate transporter receptor subunit TctC
MTISRRTFGIAASALALPAWAEDKWPSKPIAYIVPFPAGGTTDILARLIGQKLGPAARHDDRRRQQGRRRRQRRLGDGLARRARRLHDPRRHDQLARDQRQPLSEDRLRPGQVVRADQLIGTNPTVLVVNQASPVQDACRRGRGRQGEEAAHRASAGSGTSQHLSLELLKAKAGIDITHIPYKGSGPAIQDVMAGQVDMMFDTTVVAGPHIESGKLRALAVSSAKRVPSLPNVPTVAESGVPATRSSRGRRSSRRPARRRRSSTACTTRSRRS